MNLNCLPALDDFMCGGTLAFFITIVMVTYSDASNIPFAVHNAFICINSCFVDKIVCDKASFLICILIILSKNSIRILDA